MCFEIRKSMDTKLNNNGHRLLEVCKNNTLFIVNGRLGKDRHVGNYTFRNTSVIDYCIISLDMFEFYKDFEIIELDPLFSDGHCLLRSVLEFHSYTSPQESVKQMPSIRKWQPDKTEDFIRNIDCTKINSLQHFLQNNIPNKDTVNYVTNQIGEIFHETANKTFLLPKRVKGAKRNLITKNKPWFGPQCISARRSYHRARKQFDLNKTPQNRQYLSTSSKMYKRTMNRYINKFRYDSEHKLRSMQSKNPKQYWKFLNSIQSKSNAKCPTIEEFDDYFELLNALGNPQSVPIDPLENTTFDETMTF